ncbi:hypothetical protein AOA12_16210 [Microbacterium sp. No. 7]|nr:hypothetical protein AOA12_16210 [Microbacterium sp. No. 7]
MRRSAQRRGPLNRSTPGSLRRPHGPDVERPQPSILRPAHHRGRDEPAVAGHCDRRSDGQRQRGRERDEKSLLAAEGLEGALAALTDVLAAEERHAIGAPRQRGSPHIVQRHRRPLFEREQRTRRVPQRDLGSPRAVGIVHGGVPAEVDDAQACAHRVRRRPRLVRLAPPPGRSCRDERQRHRAAHRRHVPGARGRSHARTRRKPGFSLSAAVQHDRAALLGWLEC